MKTLRKLIRETLLSEAYEHTDDKIVSISNIDLRHEYDKLNDLLFNGELTDVPLSWSNTKGKYGHVSYRFNRQNRVPEHINGLFITKYFKITYRKFKDILAHEMIHVKNIQDSMRTKTSRYRGDAHGYDFFSELRRINGMGLGFNVTETESGSHDVSDHLKGRFIYLAVIQLTGRKNGEYVTGLTAKAYEDREKMERIFMHQVKIGNYKEVVVSYYSTESPYFLKYTVQRNFNTGVSYRVADEETFDKVEEDASFIETIKIDREGSSRTGRGDKMNTLTQVSAPTRLEPAPSPISRPVSRPTPPPISRPIPIAPVVAAKPEITDEMKEINRRAMIIFKSTTDKFVQEAIFDILKTSDAIKKQIKIDGFNQRFGSKFGYIN